jgi:U3 small nucleolar RNA-associated protein 25
VGTKVLPLLLPQRQLKTSKCVYLRRAELLANSLQLKKKLVPGARKAMNEFDLLERTLASHIFSYRDVLFGGRTPENAQSLRNLAALHALNHVLKTRDRVIKNNSRLAKDPDAEFRDQGFARPKVLILLPTRQSCVKYINIMMAFLQPEQQENKHRFVNSYSQTLDQWEDKPPDFQELFSGNDDDMFRLGLKITRKTVKYFSQFYNSDIILASPLGLRTAMEKSSESKKEDYDFLSSIEICVVDQTDALLMQNWQHTLLIFSRMNLLPKEAHSTDFSRVRPWYLEGHSKYLRQTLIFSAFLTPELNSLSSSHLHPIAGKVKITPPYAGAILSLPLLPPPLTLKQTFSRFPSSSPQSDPQTRLTHFTTAVLPSLLKSTTTPTLIFISTHPLFLSLRNYLSTSQSTSSVSFASISEYTSVSDVARARSNFIRGRHSLLLYTERAHHFRRYKIKGVKKVVMLGLPENPNFYGEIVGMLGLGSGNGDGGAQVAGVRVLFSKWDALKLERVVGTERVAGMLKEKGGDTFEFV